MKHINIKESSFTYAIIKAGRRFCPSLFYKKHILHGKEIYLPRWIAKFEVKQVEEKARERMKSLNWE